MSLSTASTVTKIVVMSMIGLGVLALTLMDVRGVMHGGPGIQDAATVNGVRISTRDVDVRAEDTARRMNIPRDKIDQLQIKQYVLQGLVSEKLMDEALDDMGLRFSDKAVAEELRTMLTDPKDPGGDIAQRYEMILRQTGQSRKEFENGVRTQIAKRIVNEALSAALLPNPLLDAARAARLQERRDIAVITIMPDASNVKGAPDEAALDAIYDEHKAAFTTPEKRSGRVYTLSSDALAKMTGKDGDAQASLTEIEDAFFGGDKPEDVATQYHLTEGTSLKDVTTPKGALESVLFELDGGEASGAIALEGDKGYGFVVADSIVPSETAPLDKVKPQVVALWKQDQARAQADAAAAKIKAATDPVALARKEGAKVEVKNGVAPSEEFNDLFNKTHVNEATEMPTTEKNAVRLGVVTNITHAESHWTPRESTAKDFQTAQSQNADELFYQLMAPYAAKASIRINQKALAPAPKAQE